MNKKDASKRWKEVDARNLKMCDIAPSLVFKEGNRGVREFGRCVARHVRKDELDDSDDNMDFGLLPLLEAKNDVAVFGWFERFFGDAVIEYVDAIDDGKQFLEGVYEAHKDGTLGQSV